jgi:hypothetical protein
LFARLIKEYGLSWEAVMEMPIKRFWFMSNMIQRLWAERDLRQVQLLAFAGSKDGYEAATKSLIEERGTIYVWETTPAAPVLVVDPKTGLDPAFDRAGLRALKGKGSVNR